MFKTRKVKVYMNVADINADAVKRIPEKNYKDNRIIRIKGTTVLIRTYKVPRRKVKDFKKGLIRPSDVMYLNKKEMKKAL